MDKKTSFWLRSSGFEEDRGFHHVWQYRTLPFQISSTREALLCFELASEADDKLSMCVTMEARGTVPENYSEGSVWLFTEKGTDAKQLFQRCINLVSSLGFGIRSSLEVLNNIVSKP